MREFFRGWRRKIGVVTLLMALVAMGGWVRSLYSVDVAQRCYSGSGNGMRKGLAEGTRQYSCSSNPTDFQMPYELADNKENGHNTVVANEYFGDYDLDNCQ